MSWPFNVTHVLAPCREGGGRPCVHDVVVAPEGSGFTPCHPLKTSKNRGREPTHPGKPGEPAAHPGWISRRFAGDIAVNIGSRVAGIVVRIHRPGQLHLPRKPTLRWGAHEPRVLFSAPSRKTSSAQSCFACCDPGRAQSADARRVQPHPGRVCSPTPVFGFTFGSFVLSQEARGAVGWLFAMGGNPAVEGWDSLCEKVIHAKQVSCRFAEGIRFRMMLPKPRPTARSSPSRAG